MLSIYLRAGCCKNISSVMACLNFATYIILKNTVVMNIRDKRGLMLQ
jgi:hypothetical protein